MDVSAAALHQAFVGAFGHYLNEVTGPLQGNLPREVIREATDWLARELASVLELPFAEQRRSPLEIVQEATAGPNQALAEAGVRPPLRDPVSVAALPGDTYGLAPASSSALGEEAFHAHLAWGVEKAQALAPLVSGEGRTVLLVSRDLIDRSRFEDAVNAAGLQLVVWGSDLPVAPVVAFVDLTHPEADEAIRSVVESVEVIAFGPHVDEPAFDRALLLGVKT
ncbi:MAG: hypothetical protein OER12_08785, partial [Acidimicrobiia bacterium]|nr:hypothetical protein [Acidimicrobiia bacterium]